MKHSGIDGFGRQIRSRRYTDSFCGGNDASRQDPMGNFMKRPGQAIRKEPVSHPRFSPSSYIFGSWRIELSNIFRQYQIHSAPWNPWISEAIIVAMAMICNTKGNCSQRWIFPEEPWTTNLMIPISLRSPNLRTHFKISLTRGIRLWTNKVETSKDGSTQRISFSID